MKLHFIFVALIATALLSNADLSLAVESKADAAQEAAAKVAPKSTQGNDTKRKAVKIKLVDINSATREQLKKLPGIGNAEADKIIAGRPYGSKANLVTQNIIPRGVYENIKKNIISRQHGSKNAALPSQKK